MDKQVGAVYGNYNSRPTKPPKEISFATFFKSVTTKYMLAYVKKRSDFSTFGQKLVTTERYWKTLLWESNVTMRSLCYKNVSWAKKRYQVLEIEILAVPDTLNFAGSNKANRLYIAL